MDSFETISLTNKTLGHPAFVIKFKKHKVETISQFIKITNWNNVINKLNRTNPIFHVNSNSTENKSTRLAESILIWMNQTISSETTNKAVNIKKIFDHNKLLMPNNNPNDNNIQSWKNFYKTVNNLLTHNPSYNNYS